MTRRYPISPVPRYTLGDIVTVVIACIVTVIAFMALLALFLISVKPAHATYKPEYAKNPPAVQEWFGAQKIMPAAGIRLGLGQNASCCDHADRLFTKFVGTGTSEWLYYPDPDCTTNGCKLLPIPNDTVHSEEIRALNPKDDGLPQFDQMRSEGVLMIWAGSVTCFWPPEPGI